MLRVTYQFDSDAFGPGCTFEARRVISVRGTVDSGTGDITGDSRVLAWGNPGETCTFTTGPASEDATVTGTLDMNTGLAALTIHATDAVAGPFTATIQFDSQDFQAANPNPADTTLATFGAVGGTLLAGGSLAWWATMRSRRQRLLLADS